MSADAYECASDVKWLVESSGILIVHPRRGAYCCLPYPAAAVWDFVSRGYRLPKIVKMTQYIGGFQDAAATEGYVAECLTAWANAGLVRRVEGGEQGV
jgi:hypothetical protein